MLTIEGKDIDFVKIISDLENNEIVVGIPDANAGREGGAISDASLLFIHTNGSPVRGIPPRPVIEPAIEQDHVFQGICELMSNAALQLIEGNEGAMLSGLEEAGEYALAAVKAYFNEANGWAPNKETTIRRKGSSAPLIDTGSMRGAITFQVRKKGG